jgi:hypothetical protein
MAAPTAIHTGLEVAANIAAPTPVPRATPMPVFIPEGLLSAMPATLGGTDEKQIPEPTGADIGAWRWWMEAARWSAVRCSDHEPTADGLGCDVCLCPILSNRTEHRR